MVRCVYRVKAHDPREDSDEDVAERVAFANELLAEVLPDEEPAKVEDAIARLRAFPARERMWSVRARDADGRLVGIASTGFDPEHDDNPEILVVGLSVHPDHRRRRIGTRLLAALVEIADAEGRRRIITSTSELRPAGEAFALVTGAIAKQHDHVNRLLIADVDRQQLEHWVADAAVRSADYELIAWDGPVPEVDMDRWLDLVVVMNTAPRDDLEVNDFTLTAEEVRDGERRAAAVGWEAWTLVARDRSTGEWAGFHDVGWSPSDPKIMEVGATAVRSEHRGHALGKWLKAAMTLRILDERPDVAEIRTGNADSNDAMLGINTAMGYRPWIGATTWELDVESARRFTEKR